MPNEKPYRMIELAFDRDDPRLPQIPTISVLQDSDTARRWLNDCTRSQAERTTILDSHTKTCRRYLDEEGRRCQSERRLIITGERTLPNGDIEDVVRLNPEMMEDVLGLIIFTHLEQNGHGKTSDQ